MATSRRLAVMVTVIATVGLATLGAAWACTPQATIDLRPEEVVPEDRLTVVGDHFVDDGAVEMFWESPDGERQRVAETTGPAFSEEVAVPAEAAPGTYYVEAHGYGEGTDSELRGTSTAAITVVEPQGAVGGQVTDAISGRAISDARVTVTDADGELIDEATSDRDGNYAIDGLGVGAHTLSADADGYNPASQPIDVERDETTTGDLTLAPESEALPYGAVSRVAGPDRFATAARLSTASFEPGVPAAYVATGGRFADALTGGVAAAMDHAPVLLTTGEAIPEVTVAELDRLEPQRIVVVGGPDAVSADVADELARFTDGDVARLAGPDRFATAAEVVRASFDGAVDTAYVAAGSGFADALAGAPAAASAPGPLLLAAGDALPPATVAELDRLDPDRIVVLGGTAAVSEAAEAALADHGDVDRIAGADRYDTAAALAVADDRPETTTAFVTTGARFPDALAAGALAGSEHAPMLLITAEAVPTTTGAALDHLEPDRIVVMGGPAVVSDAVATELERYLPSNE